MCSSDLAQAEEIYIGLRDIIDLETFRQYVTDWRAPSAAVYYQENELGPVSYKNGGKEIRAELLAKYQIEIENGELIRVIDSTEQIYDEILQMVLSSPASPKMKEIARTLQREQSEIIRTELNRNLIVQGVAGSGKTSAALHRAAYMMYVDKSLKADNILLVTPSESFAGYVSQVLPSLDEENVRSLTMEQIQRYELGDAEGRYYKFGFAPVSEAKRQALSGPEWIDYAEEFAEFVTSQVFQPREIKTDSFTVPQGLLERLYHQNYRYLPPFKRLMAIFRHLRELIKGENFHPHAAEVYEALEGMFLLHNIRQSYEVFVRFVTQDKAVDPALFGEVPDEADREIMALLKVKLYGAADNSWVRHLIADEMQDLSFAAHETLRLAFRCPRTLLGDVNQAVRFRLPEDYIERLQKVYARDPIKTITRRLDTSYRSTQEITEFSREILKDNSIRPLKRHGEEVKFRRFAPGEQEALYRAAYEQLIAWREKGCRTAAYIAADAEEARAFARWLEAENARTAFKPLLFNDYLREEEEFAVTITDVARAKGVEFDAVLIPDCSADHYKEGTDRTRLYVAATRALHFLSLMCQGEPSPFLTEKMRRI